MWKLDERFVPAGSISHSDDDPQDHSGSKVGSSIGRPNVGRSRHELPEGMDASRSVIFYVGGESLALNNVLMTHRDRTVSVTFLSHLAHSSNYRNPN